MRSTMMYDNDLTDVDCIFCDAINGDDSLIKVIEICRSAACFLDTYPVTRFHTLIVPVRHAEDYFHLTKEEKEDIDHLISKYTYKMMTKDKSITGFNIGWNCGRSAGQTIFHAHCHLIPRRHGDIEDPTGGVRGVIPEKRIYK